MDDCPYLPSAPRTKFAIRFFPPPAAYTFFFFLVRYRKNGKNTSDVLQSMQIVGATANTQDGLCGQVGGGGGVIGRSYETRRKNKKEEERERTKGKRGEVYTMVVDGSRRQTWAATHTRQQPHRTLQVWGRVLPLSLSLPLSLCRLANFLHTLFFQRTPRTKKRKRKIIVGVVLHLCQASNF